MCDLNKIGALIAAACAAVIVAATLCSVAALAAGTFYSAPGNMGLIAAAAVSIGIALVAINVAIPEVGPCAVDPCKGFAQTLQNALIAIALSLTVLLAALVVGMFSASIPWVGIAISIALGVGATAIGVSLVVAGQNLGGLERCKNTPPSGGVGAATSLATIAVIALVVATVFIVF